MLFCLGRLLETGNEFFQMFDRTVIKYASILSTNLRINADTESKWIRF